MHKFETGQRMALVPENTKCLKGGWIQHEACHLLAAKRKSE